MFEADGSAARMRHARETRRRSLADDVSRDVPRTRRREEGENARLRDDAPEERRRPCRRTRPGWPHAASVGVASRAHRSRLTAACTACDPTAYWCTPSGRTGVQDAQYAQGARLPRPRPQGWKAGMGRVEQAEEGRGGKNKALASA